MDDDFGVVVMLFVVALVIVAIVASYKPTPSKPIDATQQIQTLVASNKELEARLKVADDDNRRMARLVEDVLAKHKVEVTCR